MSILKRVLDELAPEGLVIISPIILGNPTMTKLSDTEVTITTQSRPTIPARQWMSEVDYDHFGVPYAHNFHGNFIQLYANGSTADTWLTGDKWEHAHGRPVEFPPEPPMVSFVVKV